jgi:ferredoxin
MPIQVVVVQRPRRSLFAVPRALPDWLRLVWATFFRTSTGDTDRSRMDSTRAGSLDTPLFPRLTLDGSGSHRCVGCGLCIQVCPSRCLAIGTEGQGEELEVTRFDLVRGACIGCGLCDEACPENAIELVAGCRVELAPFSGRLGIADLLLDRSSSVDDGGRVQNGRD